jgi:hypothetical protein
MIAIICAVVGFVIFTVLYFHKIEGRFAEALAEPRTLLIFVFPFLPAIVLSWMAERAQKRFLDIVHAHTEAAPPAPDRQE